MPGSIGKQQKIRNRVVRSIFCTTKHESQERRFLLEVNELPCDIQPIASDGSTELRYLQSTKNLYDYLLTYGNDTILHVKLIRGDPPLKATDFDGYMVFRTVLTGDRIPICNVNDLEISLASPDLPVRVKLPTSESSWRSLSEIRAAELQCMQLSLALLSRHESEVFVTADGDKSIVRYFQSNSLQESRAGNYQSTSETIKKNTAEPTKTSYYTSGQNAYSTQIPSTTETRLPSSRISVYDDRNYYKTTPMNYQDMSKAITAQANYHARSDKLYRDAEKSVGQTSQRYYEKESSSSQRTVDRENKVPTPKSKAKHGRSSVNARKTNASVL